ncbi:MAG: BA14K family protein [Pseudolabrys sp.]|nr:BA14K family protein [Pseudolabrys sp.]
MSFIVYFFVLAITVSSVLFGMDWLSAPMSPMPPGKPAIQTANRPAPAPVQAVASPAKPAPPAVVRPQETVATAPAPIAAPVQAEVSPPAAVSPPVEAVVPVIAAAPPGEADSSSAPEPPASPLCDVNACTAAYRSFTASDCTYQPSNGPRRLCTRGEPPRLAVNPAVAETARAQSCNVSACAAAYGSFDASDCTYQPFDGPRRVCTR